MASFSDGGLHYAYKVKMPQRPVQLQLNILIPKGIVDFCKFIKDFLVYGFFPF